MSPFRFSGALVVSIALIGGALWFRFVKVPPYTAPLVTVKENLELTSDSALLKDFVGGSTTPRTVSTTTLSEADSLGRQIFSEYIGLKSKGNLTQNSINALADKYAETIINTDIPVDKVTINQLIVLPDSELNLKNYGTAITNIRLRYKGLVSSQYGGSSVTDITSPAFSKFMGEVGSLYGSAAKELLAVGVPTSLSENHMNLINNYLESAEALKLISEISKNPMDAYAGLNVYSKNIDGEAVLLGKIKARLTASGIIFDSNI